MTTLEDFGVDVTDDDGGEDESTEEPSPNRTYRNGRCPAIAVGNRRRCRSPTSRMKSHEPYCGTHDLENDPWTIHDDPETLILLIGNLDANSLDDLDPDAVDFDLARIREAVQTVKRGEA